MAYQEQGPCPVKPVFYLLNVDTQDRQDKQEEKLLLRKLTRSMIECAFVENLRVLRGPSRTPFESLPTPWNPFSDSSFAPLTDPGQRLGALRGSWAMSIIDLNPRRRPQLKAERKREALAQRRIGQVPPEVRRYRERSTVERVNGRLKDEFGGRPLADPS